MTENDLPHIVYSLILLAFLGSSFFLKSNQKSKKIKQLLVWFIIIFVILILYSYRDIFSGFQNRIAGELNPTKAIVSQNNVIEIRKADDNHFYIQLKINNKNILFLIDTGASDITLSLRDAKRIGVNINKLKFNKPYMTANGMIYGAPIKINKVKISSLEFRDIYMSVNKEKMNTSLLGMSFLNRFSEYQIIGDKLFLKP